jgi:hypothetical protein
VRHESTSRRFHLALLNGGSGECKSSKREHERNVDGKGAHYGGKEEEEGTSIEQSKVKSQKLPIKKVGARNMFTCMFSRFSF